MHSGSIPRFVLVSLFAGRLAAQVFGAVQATGLPVIAGVSVSGLSVDVADANGDGRGDVLVAARSHDIVFTLSGDGTGGFGAMTESSVPIGIPAAASGGLDVNRDGRVDLVMSGGPGTNATWVVLGDGAGGFTQGAQILGMPLHFHVMNLDGDEQPDVVSQAGQAVSLARGAAGGGFLPAVAVPPPPGLALPLAPLLFASGDANGDGAMDLLIGGLGPPVALFGDGQGGFPAGFVLPMQAFLPRALADFDQDGSLDLLAEDNAGTLRVFRNDGTGGFLPSGLVLSSSGASLQIRPVRAIDLDGDGFTDVLNMLGTSLLVHMGDGAGGFAAPQSYLVGSVDAMTVGDLDADGRADVVMVGGGSVKVLRNAWTVATGLSAYGQGTPTCRGTLGIRGTKAPRLGTNDFRVQCTNVPPSATGLLLIGTKVAAGWDPLGLDLRLHLGLWFPVGTMRSDPGGAASRALPIPSTPWLVGWQASVQTVWMADPGLGDTCSRARFELASSRGLTITLLP